MANLKRSTVRVYLDGCFDGFHYGHGLCSLGEFLTSRRGKVDHILTISAYQVVNAILQAVEMFPDSTVQIIAGVHSDQEIIRLAR